MALPPVPGAVRNATDWYLYLANTLKVPPANLTLLKNNEATVEKLRKFAARAAAQVKPGGTLWLVFIGHGAPAKDGADGVVVGFDAQQDPDSLYARSLSQTELLSILGKDAQARTVANIDACFSGRSAAGPLVPGLQPVIALRPLEATGSRVGLTAWGGDQFAGPLPWPPGGIEKLPIYAALGVKEVWVWDKGLISAHVLRGAGFVRAARSTLLPSLDLRRLAKHASMEDQSKAVRAFLKLKR